MRVCPLRLRARHGRQTLVQDAQLVGHRVAALGGHARPVDLVRGLRDPAREILTARPARRSVAAWPGTLRCNHIRNFETVPTGSGTAMPSGASASKPASQNALRSR